MLLPDMLRQSIASLHTSIEATPLASVMINGTIAKPAYSQWLFQMKSIHHNLEQALSFTTALGGLYDPQTMNRSEILKQDAEALQFEDDETLHAAVEAFVATLHDWSAESPWKLLGVLYVLEGSRMGSLALVRPLSKALGVALQKGTGIDYHLDGAAQRPQIWQAFRAKLAQFPLTPEQMVEVQSAACHTMSVLHDMYANTDVSETVECAISV